MCFYCLSSSLLSLENFQENKMEEVCDAYIATADNANCLVLYLGSETTALF